MKEIGISEFKAKCIDELKKVQRTGEPLLVTLNKQPIATVNPYREKKLLEQRARQTARPDGPSTATSFTPTSEMSGRWIREDYTRHTNH